MQRCNKKEQQNHQDKCQRAELEGELSGEIHYYNNLEEIKGEVMTETTCAAGYLEEREKF